jgi:hypothetical protein
MLNWEHIPFFCVTKMILFHEKISRGILFANLEWQLSWSSLKARNVTLCRCTITLTVPFYLYNKSFSSINPVFPLGIISWYPNEYNVWFFQSVENFVEYLISHHPRGLQIITEWNKGIVKETEFCAYQRVLWSCNTHTHTEQRMTALEH